MFSRCSQDVSKRFSGGSLDFSMRFSGCSDWSCGLGGPGRSRGPGGPGWFRGFGASCESDWLGGPCGSCESCGSGWDGGPGGSSGSCWSCGSCGSGGLGESAWLGRCGWYQVEFQLKVWILIIQKSTVIPPSLMVLFRNDQ